MTEEKKTKFEGKGEATVKNTETGEEAKVAFKGEAEVTSLASVKEEKGETEPHCIECGSVLFKGRCINANCEVAQAQATQGATRTTAKAVAATPPRAFTRAGRVD